MKHIHSLDIQICLDDFRGEFSGRIAVETVFEIIKKVEAAVFAKGGKVLSYKFDNTPTRELNPDGQIATLTFEIGTPYKCNAKLEQVCLSYMQGAGPDPQRVLIVNFTYDFNNP